MTLNIPALQMNGSIRPVFVTILESLLRDISKRIIDLRYNREKNSENQLRLDHLESLSTLVQNIDPITLNINDLRQNLLQAEALDSEDIELYINGLRDELGRCLKRTDFYGSNALTFVSHQYRVEVAHNLLAMSYLNKEQQFEILKHTDFFGRNALMFAAENHSEAVASILQVMNNLSQDQQVAILNQTHKFDSCNTLMFALRYRLETVASLLQAMDNLRPEQQFVILSQVSKPHGSNALMIAAQFHPEVVASILQIINNFRPRQKVQILLQSDDEGNSALEFLARHGKSGVNPALRLAREAIDTIYNQDKTNPISTAASSSAASSSSDVTPVTSGHSFFSNSTTTNPPERIEQPLIDKLILAVEVAQKKYSNYVKSGTKRSSEFNRGNSPSPISSLLHNDTGSEKSLALSAIISKSSDVISIKKELFDFFNAKDTTYHAHSFVSYLIDELIRITPEAKIKPSTRYNKTMLTPLLDAIGSNPSKGTSGALDRDELESGHNTVVIG